MRFIVLTLTTLLLSLGTPILAQDIEKGLAAAQAGDFATALQEWKPLAEQGYANAQFNLGVMYDNGQSIPQDYKEAVNWYRQSAEQGVSKAQTNLGVMYGQGQGVLADFVRAHMWFNIASANGDENGSKAREVCCQRNDPRRYLKSSVYGQRVYEQQLSKLWGLNPCGSF